MVFSFLWVIELGVKVPLDCNDQPDHLGSARLLTDLNQAIVQNLDYLPFGELNSSDSGINSHKFTELQRDSETGLDHAWFRQYSSTLGRWMHPDPAGLAAVDPSNPQSWNRYGYVINNPLALVDPSGMDYCDGGNSPYTSGGGGTTNLSPPCQIAPGVWDASYNGPAVTGQSLQNQTWQAVDTFFNSQGISEYVPLPTGLMNAAPNQGDIGVLGAQEMAIGSKEILKRIIADWNKVYADDALAWLLSDFSRGGEDAVLRDQNVLNSLQMWQSVTVPAVPAAPCAMNAGLAMGVWKAQLLAWIKSHPGQQPPPEIATPPSLSGVCG